MRSKEIFVKSCREKLLSGERAAVALANCIEKMREYEHGLSPRPFAGIVRVYCSEKERAEKDPSSVTAFRLETAELVEELKLAQETGVEILDNWDEEGTIKISRVVDGCIVDAEYVCVKEGM